MKVVLEDKQKTALVDNASLTYCKLLVCKYVNENYKILSLFILRFFVFFKF